MKIAKIFLQTQASRDAIIEKGDEEMEVDEPALKITDIEQPPFGMPSNAVLVKCTGHFGSLSGTGNKYYYLKAAGRYYIKRENRMTFECIARNQKVEKQNCPAQLDFPHVRQNGMIYAWKAGQHGTHRPLTNSVKLPPQELCFRSPWRYNKNGLSTVLNATIAELQSWPAERFSAEHIAEQLKESVNHYKSLVEPKDEATTCSVYAFASERDFEGFHLMTIDSIVRSIYLSCIGEEVNYDQRTAQISHATHLGLPVKLASYLLKNQYSVLEALIQHNFAYKYLEGLDIKRQEKVPADCETEELLTISCRILLFGLVKAALENSLPKPVMLTSKEEVLAQQIKELFISSRPEFQDMIKADIDRIVKRR